MPEEVKIAIAVVTDMVELVVVVKMDIIVLKSTKMDIVVVVKVCYHSFRTKLTQTYPTNCTKDPVSLIVF